MRAYWQGLLEAAPPNVWRQVLELFDTQQGPCCAGGGSTAAAAGDGGRVEREGGVGWLRNQNWRG